MNEKIVLWDHELLDRLYKVSGCKKKIIKDYIIKIAIDLKIEMPNKINK